jgi:hypothetical protein
MSRLRKLVLAGLGLAATALIAALERTPTGRRLSRRAAHRVARLARYESGRLEGFRYRLAGRGPDPEATDAVLADRIRSRLGPLEHKLDLPRVHVTACGHDVVLHGEVDSPWHADQLMEAVAKVPGVAKVDSRLAVGPLRHESRPSQSAAHPQESSGLHKVLAAAHGAGVKSGTERSAARGVISTFLDLLPAGERQHVLGHLPADVRALADAEARVLHRHIRRFDELSTAALPTLPPETRGRVVESVLGAMRELVPEEAADVSAVLPEELRHLWKTAVPL